MDPTFEMCLIKDSFSPQQQFYTIEDPYEANDVFDRTKVKLTKETSIETLDNSGSLEELFEEIRVLKTQLSGPEYNERKKQANPFSSLDPSVFSSRKAIELANVDAIFLISGYFDANYKRQSTIDLANFVIGGTGGFVEYIQYRWKYSVCYAMTKREHDWDFNNLNLDRFSVLYGNDQTGRIDTNYNYIIKYRQSRIVEEIFLVSAELDFEHELLYAALVATKLLITNGNFVVCMPSFKTKLAHDVLFILAQCFDNVSLFKPVSSDPFSEEVYVICRRLREQGVITLCSGILLDAAKANAKSIISELPEDYKSWLIRLLTVIGEKQLEMLRKVVDIKENNKEGKGKERENLDLHKALIVWNLPSSYEFIDDTENEI
jgi:23S rRNA methylase